MKTGRMSRLTLRVLMVLGVKTLGLLFLPAFFIFTAFGILTVLTTVFLANTVDYGELKNYRRDESVIFSMVGMAVASEVFHRKYILTQARLSEIVEELESWHKA